MIYQLSRCMDIPLYRDSTGCRQNKATRLLIIDDNPDHGFLIQNAVKQSMPTVTPVVVTSEQEVLDYLDQCSIDMKMVPKLILLDLYFPEREDGWRMLEQIRLMADVVGKIPVVLVSYSICRTDVNEAYDRGCISYLAKPDTTADWVAYFKAVHTYWLDTVTLPQVGHP